MIVSHNIASFNIYTKYRSALTDSAKAMSQITSGLRVNSAGDDPYAVAKDEVFNMQLRSLQMANSNAQDAISLIQTTDGALDGITSMLQRVRELAVQSRNGTYNSENRNDAQHEVNTLKDGVDYLATSTDVNDVNLLAKPLAGASTGTNQTGSVQCMIGYNAGETIEIPTFSFRSADIKCSNIKNKDGNDYSLNDVDVSTPEGCDDAIKFADFALDAVNRARGKYGALQNRLESTITNQSEISIQTENGDSEIMDVDVAASMLEYSKSSIIVQAGTAMMAQSNKFPQQVLEILQNVR